MARESRVARRGGRRRRGEDDLTDVDSAVNGPAKRAAWTIGHSTRSIDELIRSLEAAAIAVLVDVRTVPRSRRNPQFNGDELSRSLAAARIDYRHEPRLGGLRKPRLDSINTAWKNPGFRGYADHMQTPEFASAIAALGELVAVQRIAVLCAEAVPWRCHRSLIADALTVRGIEVRHIFGPRDARVHTLTPWAHVADDGRLTYPGVV